MSDIIAKVNGTTITSDDVDKFIASLSQQQRIYAADPNFRTHCSQQLVERELFYNLGIEDGVEDTPDYKETMEAFRKNLIGRIAITNLFKDIESSEAEMKEYYEKHKDDFKKGAVASARHILVDEEAKCKEIKDEIAKGDITFADAAKKYSSCPSKENGGDLGTFERGQMVPEFDEVTFTGNLNEVLGPVKTQFGYHLIFIENRKDASVATYEEVEEQIRQAIVEGKQNSVYEAKVAELKDKFLED
ncbi:peptidylprolyl isomerase [Eubacterium oxidoreducens]|uniref:Peptidyl-prolyl cis-trans isomerase C n=1 Tax=Eubacterium oxidoreducens TaxID=1732 RepID=A0A1G6C1R1_EUBOX|nr:peptidylprolyl isomerase [Eubacterium oxidoreducens]SDB26785.1 peptidyl-prolyl cis-trans isomerase C [Eubacterium oxidoreducens]